MKYVCLIYFDPQQVFNQSPESNAVLAEVGPYNDAIKASGHRVTGEALTLPNEAMTVRVRDGRMSATDGPFMETKEMLAGFILIEARDLNEAVQIAARDPFARMGAIDVRAVVDYSKPRPKLWIQWSTGVMGSGDRSTTSRVISAASDRMGRLSDSDESVTILLRARLLRRR